MAENLALECAPMTQEPHRNQDSRGSGAHYFCHAKYTDVSQTLWRGLRYASQTLRRGFLGKPKIPLRQVAPPAYAGRRFR